jgi:hypothetical protein
MRSTLNCSENKPSDEPEQNYPVRDSTLFDVKQSGKTDSYE